MCRRGLYWVVSCRCDAQRGKGKRLLVLGSNGKTDLGLLYWVDGGFGLDVTVPVKRLGEGELCFTLGGPMGNTECIMLDPMRPFDYLDRLEWCRFALRDGKPCIVLPRKK